MRRPQAATPRMKHYMQDAATDLGVELPLTKLQYTAFMKEGVPRLRMKAAVTRHLLPVLLRMIEILLPTPRRPRPPSLPVPAMPLPRVRGILQVVGEAIAAKGAGTFPQVHRTPHVACAGSTHSWTVGVDHATHHMFDQTGNPAQFWNYGDESAIGWASNVAETMHVSVLPRALMQNEALDTNEALDILSALEANLTLD